VGERGVVGQVVDRHDLDVSPHGVDRAAKVTADAAEPIDAYPDGHGTDLLVIVVVFVPG
jgi:hypothetical protein